MRILAVDYGQKRIGLALSDETGTLAKPLYIIPHVSRVVDAAQVAERAAAHGAGRIVIGVSYYEDGMLNTAGHSAARFADALRQQTDLAVVLWDESLTTQDARAARMAMGASRKQRSGHLDEVAAALLLQNYLDAQSHSQNP
jgi:putative Holliday junction resolvase